MMKWLLSMRAEGLSVAAPFHAPGVFALRASADLLGVAALPQTPASMC